MYERLNVVLAFDVKTVEGDPFFDFRMTYYGMDRAKLVEVEGALVGALTNLVDVARQNLPVAKSDHNETK